MQSQKYLIVSLDGGGVRCALQIVILQRIFQQMPALESRVKLVAGTSAGALVGAAFGALGCAEMVHHMLKEDFARSIFSESWTHEVKSMRGLYRASYTNKQLKALLQRVFGIKTNLNHFKRADDSKPNLLVTSFCIDTSPEAPAEPECIEMIDLTGKRYDDNTVCDWTDSQQTVSAAAPEIAAMNNDDGKGWRWRGSQLLLSWLPYFSKSTQQQAEDPAEEEIARACQQTKLHEKALHRCTGDAWHAEIHHTYADHGNESFVDVLLKSTAAPTYFPAHRGCIDGGVVAQNPSMLAISHALKYERNLSLQDIVLLSIGTGLHPMNMNAYGKNADLGLAQWVPNLMYVFNDGSLDATELNCRNLLPENQYLRLQVPLQRNVDLANYTEWATLVQWANEYCLTDVLQQLGQLFPEEP